MNPQAPSAIPAQVKKRQTVRVFNLVTTIIFVLALVATIGVFLYANYLKEQVSTSRNNLNEISSVDHSKKIAEIEAYDSKLNIAYTLLDNHIAPSALLNELESTTKETVQLTSLKYSYDPGFEIMLTLGGNTEELSSVALQKMEILKSGIFSDFAVIDITANNNIESVLGDNLPAGVQEDTGVDFTVKGIFKKDVLKYSGSDEQEMEVEKREDTDTVEATGDVVSTEDETLIEESI